MANTATINYYKLNSGEFFKSTVMVDIAELHARFLIDIPSGGLILDAGCGSGRDAKVFIDAGYRIVAFDASACLSRQYCSYAAGVSPAVQIQMPAS